MSAKLECEERGIEERKLVARAWTTYNCEGLREKSMKAITLSLKFLVFAITSRLAAEKAIATPLASAETV